MKDLIGLRLPADLRALVAKEADLSGNSLQSVIRHRLAERYKQLRESGEIRESSDDMTETDK